MTAKNKSNNAIQKVGKPAWMGMMRCMMLGRYTEERMIRLYHQAKVFGGVYTGVGQEAIGAATTAACEKQDLFTPGIRNITVHIGRGESVLNIFRQFLGRAAGPMRGRDGNVHYGNPEHGVYAMISHLGAMLPVLVGAVMARRMQGQNAIGIAYTGDGATSTGDFHEALNFASVFDVPVMFVIENNKYAYSTPNSSQYRCKNLADRAPGYGMEGFLADGNDLVELHLLTREIVTAMREQPRPVLVECDTMRIRGHGEHDDCSYVPKELREEYLKRDPLDNARKRFIAEGIASEEELDVLSKECLAEIDKTYNQALHEPAPDPATLMDGIYADE